MGRPESILITQDEKGPLWLNHRYQCSTVHQYLPLCFDRTLPRLFRRKIAMLHTFTVSFQETSKKCVLLLAALAGLTESF